MYIEAIRRLFLGHYYMGSSALSVFWCFHQKMPAITRTTVMPARHPITIPKIAEVWSSGVFPTRELNNGGKLGYSGKQPILRKWDLFFKFRRRLCKSLWSIFLGPKACFKLGNIGLKVKKDNFQKSPFPLKWSKTHLNFDGAKNAF